MKERERERASGLGWLLSMGIGDVQLCFFSSSLVVVPHNYKIVVI